MHNGVLGTKKTVDHMKEKLTRLASSRALPTVSSISKLAGFSPSTVSRALKGDARISEKTRATIAAIAQEQGYAPNAYARSLVTQSSGLVGIVLDRLANPFYGELAEHLHKRLVEIGKYPMILRFDEGALETEEDVIQPILQYRMDGCIIASASLTSRVAEACARHRVPMVMINRVARAHSCAVSCNNYRGGIMVGELLVEAGHMRIAYVSGRQDTSTSEDRESGLRHALQKVGREPLGVVRGHYTYDGGYAAGRELLSRRKRPDAIFAANDITALGVIDAARNLGLSVPNDVSIVGFDDIQAARWHSYRLTTVAQPVDAMITRALALLAERMHNPELEGEDISIQGELRIRSSARLPAHMTATPLSGLE
jgi:DNA-binding LacI/PurR family transcriptional regulator